MSDFSCFLPPKLGSPVACAIGEFFATNSKGGDRKTAAPWFAFERPESDGLNQVAWIR